MFKEMGIPESIRIIMTRRGESFLVPNGKTVLKEGDWLLVISEDNMAKAQQVQEEEDDYNLREWQMQIITNTSGFFRDQWHRLTQGNNHTEKN